MAGKVVVRETCEGKFAQHVVAGRHVLRADEPTASGGLDSGISPYDFLLAGLGACTATTLRLYAERKHLPLERVTVEPRHDKLHTADCADCESRAARIDRIERLIRLEGTLAPADRAKLLEIADKCPVHRTLHGEIEIPTRLMDD
ncbi:MAG: OsmC family protein [Burkholderiales bacterium]|nr:OsmC family protein [Burkholderiales bacterium]